MRKIIFKLFIVFGIHLPKIAAQNIRCQKVDFNRPTSVVDEFEQCPGENGESLNALKINSYSATTITPFRPGSAFHLSATDEGLSCLQSTSMFSLDINSEVRTAIFLSWMFPGAWINVQILDTYGEQIDTIVESEESNKWTAFHGKVNRTIENARIVILTNMNTDSIMALEYVYVLNSVVMDDECVDEDTEPPTNEPTDEPTDWPSNEFTDESTNETDKGNTTDNSSENTDPSTTVINDTTTATPATTFQTQSTIWMSLSILFFATTIIALAGIYYFIWLYRRKTCTQSMMTTPVYVDQINNLPRLQVVNSVNIDGDHIIVGMDKL